jgi:general secretion pathway protein A
MEQLRQRVIASCHLGPIAEDETLPYIEHRLRHAGWDGAPIFDGEAIAKIFAFTSGIPRRINLLCNRLLLGAFLASRRHVSALDAGQTAREILAEIGPLGCAIEG